MGSSLLSWPGTEKKMPDITKNTVNPAGRILAVLIRVF
jgi:hypothetical protein